MNATADQKKAALAIIVAVSETIREMGTVPSGYLYSALMTRFPNLGLGNYEAIIAMLKRTGLVSEKNHELTWTGPRIES